MTEHKKRWKVAAPIATTAGADADQILPGYPPVLRQILYNRGYQSGEAARQFLEADPPADNDPLKMKDMPAAVERIRYAIAHGEPLAVYGDYDADGVTATALLTDALSALGAEVVGYIPNRFDEGYGMNRDALDGLKEQGIRLVITVDSGIRSLPEAAYAQEIGLDLIITDHHHPGSETPVARAVINPKQIGDEYPEKDLAGVGLAYKLATALFGEQATQAEHYLDLVAIGTVADLVPLTGENRWLVRRGLDYLHRPTRQGVMSLIGAAGLIPETITTYNIGFGLGPRLNAAGRLDSAKDALELLTTTDLLTAGKLAQRLDNQNRDRQRLTQEIQQRAEQIALSEDPEARLLFAAAPDFNAGVVGLAASRLTERYYRPAIVATQMEEVTRGSCRSIPEFHITDALDQCADLLVKHGGHAAAAGFTVRNEHLAELVRRLRAIADEQLAGQNLRPELNADLDIPLYELRPVILEYLKQLEPTGQANPRAVFVSRNLRVTRKQRVGSDGTHLRLELSDGRINYSAIAFQQGHWFEQMPERIDVMYYYETNEYNGRSTLQLNVIDLKPSGLPDD